MEQDENNPQDTNRIKDSGDKANLIIPGSIILAGVIIAGAIIASGGEFKAPAGGPVAAVDDTEIVIAPVTSDDHILGSLNARVYVIEFSDLECPFCKTFHATMKEIIEEYGERGEVAWVFRNFPLESLHKKARKEAEAAECANELGGQVAFWEYIDTIFEITPSNDGLDLDLLPQIAEDIGLNRSAFETCLLSGKYSDEIDKDIQDAFASGARGTPHSIIMSNDGKIRIPVRGAYPINDIRDSIEEILNS